jgi:ankyrin repeat protein
LCQYLLEHGADPNFELPETGETPLHAATSKANRPAYDHVVQVLLSYGADPGRAARAGAPTAAFMRDARTRGETPLHRAAAFGGERTIRMLLEAGARLDARDANGDTPLAWASWHLRPAAVLRLLCYGPFRIHPDNDSNYDHGAGWGSMDSHARGRPGGGPSGRGASSSRA